MKHKIKRFYYSESRKFEFSALCKTLASKHIPYNLVDNEDLEKLSGTVHHQGVVAMIEQPKIKPLTTDITDEWLHNKESALLLDRVGNANNLGAIVRSAAFLVSRTLSFLWTKPKPPLRQALIVSRKVEWNLSMSILFIQSENFWQQ